MTFQRGHDEDALRERGSGDHAGRLVSAVLLALYLTSAAALLVAFDRMLTEAGGP